MTSAADLVRTARRRANLTQSEVAQRAGVAQSVVSAYESGRREPSFEQLRRLVAASGFDLVTTVAPRAGRLADVRAHREELLAALTPLGATGIRVFGSVARGTERPDSDVDLLVDVSDRTGLFALLRMKTEAERILGTKVDIAPTAGLKSDARDAILTDAVTL